MEDYTGDNMNSILVYKFFRSFSKKVKLGWQTKKKAASYMVQSEGKQEDEKVLDLDTAIKLKCDASKMLDSYLPRPVENYWYDWWLQKKYFEAVPQNTLNGKKKYVMVIPPPNVTGYLHIGHALTGAIEDSLCRRKRMQGYETLYLPGTDHAGIATHSVVEKKLMKETGQSRHDLGRDKFVAKIWEWKETHGNAILNQLKKIGSGLDWSRFHFTMDDQLSRAVNEAFVRFAEKGLIYRANRLVNWSCKLRTAISDIEVEHIDIEKPTKMQIPGHSSWYEFGVLIHFAYQLKEDPSQTIVVATTRIETMLGDVAVAVNSKDPRYQHLIGKELIHPFIPTRKMKIITDDTLVDMNFGTGAVKITPAHDPNDYECGKRHNLEFINIFDDDGKINENGGPYKGLLRFDARVQVLKDLEARKLFKEKTPNKMKLAKCQRSGDIVEPMIRPQWYVKCEEISKRMVEVVKSKELEIIPQEFENEWYAWLSNPRDWCISRQLWWGHRIPAYTFKVTGGKEPDSNSMDSWIIARTQQDALEQAAKRLGVPQDQVVLRQDEDVLDTWFSSGLFPFSTMGWPDEKNPDLKAFYPNSILETGHDILFFWVARMVMMGLLLTETLPFKQVLLHPIVRDSDGQKMSKSKGNVVDPLEIIYGCQLDKLIKKLQEGNLEKKELERAIKLKNEEYPEGFPECGSDALRFGLLAYMMQTRSINFDIKRIIGYREFCNKIWQSFRLGLLRVPKNYVYSQNQFKFGDLITLNQWILIKLNKAVKEVNHYYDTYFFGEAVNSFQYFWRYELCDTYLETIKPILSEQNKDEQLKQQTAYTLLTCLELGMRLLHPMMPFLSEELYQKLPAFAGKCESIVIANYPEENKEWINEQVENDFNKILQLSKTIRQLSTNVNLPPKIQPETFIIIINQDQQLQQIVTKSHDVLCTLARAKYCKIVTNEQEVPKGCISSAAMANAKMFVQVKEYIKQDEEIKRLKKKINEVDVAMQNLLKKMEQKDYNTKVPLDVRNSYNEKVTNYKSEITLLNESLKAIENL